jgi:hypothetical protein
MLMMFLTVCSAFLPYPVRAADPPAWAGFANAWIASHAMRVKGDAPRDNRISCEGDVNGDGTADAVVVYTVEGVGGGNDWTQYATVLTATPQSYGATLPREVGGKSVRVVDGCSVTNRVVELALEEYAPGDASCCPSKPERVRYTFANGTLAPAAIAPPSAP